MSRQARIDAPGALHHIIMLGIERKAIFKDRSDRSNFLKRLDRIISETQTGCYICMGADDQSPRARRILCYLVEKAFGFPKS